MSTRFEQRDAMSASRTSMTSGQPKVDPLAERERIPVRVYPHSAQANKAVAKEIYVTIQNWADYVFDKNYNLPKLSEVEAFYKKNHHLPEIPSATEVEKDGVNVAEMNKLLLQKIEELTIYLVEQQKQIENQQREIDMLKKK